MTAGKGHCNQGESWMLIFFSRVTQKCLPLLLSVLRLPAFLSWGNRGVDDRRVVHLCQICNPEVFGGRPLAEKEICPIGMFI